MCNHSVSMRIYASYTTSIDVAFTQLTFMNRFIRNIETVLWINTWISWTGIAILLGNLFINTFLRNVLGLMMKGYFFFHLVFKVISAIKIVFFTFLLFLWHLWILRIRWLKLLGILLYAQIGKNVLSSFY